MLLSSARVLARAPVSSDINITLVERLELQLIYGASITDTFGWKGDWNTEAPNPISSSTGFLIRSNIPAGFVILVNSDQSYFHDIDGNLTEKESKDLEVFMDPRIGWVSLEKSPKALTPIMRDTGAITLTANYRVRISWKERGTYSLKLIYTLIPQG
jgi:hypothetical protein